MDKYTIKHSPSFEKELNNIYRHILFKLKEPMIASKLYDKIKNTIISLEYFPERYMKISNFNHKDRNMRKLIIEKYIIIYEVNKNIRRSFYLTYFSLNSKLF